MVNFQTTPRASKLVFETNLQNVRVVAVKIYQKKSAQPSGQFYFWGKSTCSVFCLNRRLRSAALARSMAEPDGAGDEQWPSEKHLLEQERARRLILHFDITQVAESGRRPSGAAS